MISNYNIACFQFLDKKPVFAVFYHFNSLTDKTHNYLLSATLSNLCIDKLDKPKDYKYNGIYYNHACTCWGVHGIGRIHSHKETDK